MKSTNRAAMLAAVAVGTLFALPAAAIPTSLISNGQMVLEDDSGEFVLRANDQGGFDPVTGEVAVGDLFGGVFEITSINGTGLDTLGTEITGVFLTRLAEITPTGSTTRDGITYDRGDFTFGAADTLMDEIFGIDPVGSGVFARLYEDDGDNLNLFSTTVGPTDQQDAIDKATDGSLFMELAFGADPDTLFQSFDVPLDLSVFAQVDSGTRLGNFNIDNALITEYNGPGGLTSDRTNANGGLFGPVNQNPFPVEDDLEFTVQVVPAPAPLALLGIGLLGLGLVSRRGKRS